MKNHPKIFSKLFAFVLFSIAAFFSVVIYKEFFRKKQIETEIEKLQAEAMRIEKQNSDIKERIAYLESADYKEREAKDKLNLQSPDENVVVVKQGVSKAEQKMGVEESAAVIPVGQTPNYLKWWNYFFKH